MPIEVTCDECFTPHRVKSEYAGRKFKCRECGAAIVVPRKAAAAGPARSAPPPRAAAPSPRASTQKKRPARGGSKSRSRGSSSGGLSGPRVWIAGGVAVLLLIVMILVPQVLGILALPLALAGIALTLWGALKCLACAFEEDATCGLMWLVVPFYNVFYTLTRWDRVGRYFLTFVGGLLLMWTPLYGLKLLTQMQRDARDYDPTTEIATDYNAVQQQAGPQDAGQIDNQVAEFLQSSANRMAAAPTTEAGGAETVSGAPTGATAAGTADSPRLMTAAGAIPRLPGRQPPPAEVLDGRPEPLPYPPRSADTVIPTQTPVEPGSEVWIEERGWWYPGTVAELTDRNFTVSVRFEGWENREPVEIDVPHLRHRTAMSQETVRYKLKLINVTGPTENLAQRIDASLARSHGYVAGSVEVDFENHLVFYETQRGGDLDEMNGAVFSLHSAGVESREIGVVKDTTPSGELMVGQVHYKDYTGTIPLSKVADLALRGYCQYVPGSAQVDEAAGVIRFVFDPHLVEDSYFDHTPLQQLMHALSYFPFGQLSQPEATPYQKPRRYRSNAAGQS